VKKVCVIGWPIKHSRSPLIHNYWLKLHRIEGSYERCAVTPDELSRFLASLADRGYVGCNVTVPHKEKVFEAVRVDDPFTRSLGAVNTVYYKDGELHGTNTDGIGFLQNLKSRSPLWRASSGPATILGAGGAARAVVATLLAEGVEEIRICNRTLERAETLVTMFGDRVRAIAWDRRTECLGECGVLVNTTTLGMTGAPPLDLALEQLPETATVYDIVYAPLMTDLLKRALTRSNPTVDGLGMLLHQAVPGFAQWFGVTPVVSDDLRALIVNDLEAQ